MFASPVKQQKTQNTDSPARSSLTGGLNRSETSDSGNLPGEVREQMEGHFGASFKDVRIHDDGEAHRRTRDLGARAYAHGNDIYFEAGLFQPHSTSGKALLAHELAHVVQQRNGRFPAPGGAAPGHRASLRMNLEQEAERAAASAASSEPFRVRESSQHDEAHASWLGDLAGQVAGGIEGMADWVIANTDAAKDSVISTLNSLRKALRGRRFLRVSAETAAFFQQVFDDCSANLPSWIPVPHIDFSGGAAQHAVQAIPILAVLLFIAFLIVFLWYAGNLNPNVRRSRQKAIDDVIEKIKEGLSKGEDPETDPKPEQKPDPKPDPKPETTVDPIPDQPKVTAEKVADSNIFMDRVEGGPVQRARIDVAYLANPNMKLYVPAAAISEATRNDPKGTQALRLAGQPGGAKIVPDQDGNVAPLPIDKIISAKFGEADLRIALRSVERKVPLLTAQKAMAAQVVDPTFPERVKAVGTTMVEIP